LPPGSENSAEVEEALAEAWRGMEPAAKEAYDACAAVEKQRFALEQLRKGVRSESHAPRIARRVREAIAIMANAPKTARASGLFEGIVGALEDLDRRLGPRVRAKLGEHLGKSIVSKEAQAIAKRVFGQLNGTRLVMLLRRWNDPLLQTGILADPPARPARLNKPGAPGAIVATRSSGPASDETRGKVTEFLARIFSKSSPESAASLGLEIERELFALAGNDPKDYRGRARALTFNLGAADGVLRRRVIGGELGPAELVRLEAEELASDALKAERDEERRKYFQTQVVLTERMQKRRRELLSGPTRGRAAERMADGGEPEEGLAESQDALPAAGAEGDAAEETAAPAMLLDAANPATPLAPGTPRELNDGNPATPQAAATPQELNDNNPATPQAPGTPLAEAEMEGLEDFAPEFRADFDFDAEDAALLLLEDTSNDDAIARLLHMMPPSPSSSSSGSDSDSDSDASADIAMAVRASKAQSSSQVEAASPPASSPQVASQTAASSSSSSSASPAPGASAGLAHVLAMGFDRGAAEAALTEARGNVEAAVALLCGAGGP